MPGPHPAKPEGPDHVPHDRDGQPETAPADTPAGFPETPGRDPEKRTRRPDPHHALNNPVGEPDPTEWPDPYDTREDPLAPPENPLDDPRRPTGAISTSQPHPSKDWEAGEWEGPKRDKVDD